jgi:predicted transport protein
MEGGFKQSALRINKYVVTQTEWREEQVIARAAELAGIAKTAWAYPVLTGEQLAPYAIKADGDKYSKDSYEWNALTEILYEKLSARILNLSAFVRREFKKYYIAYKTDVNFASVVVQNKGLTVYVNIPLAEVDDPKNICTDATKGHWGTGTTGMFLDGLAGLDDVMNIIEQSHSKQVDD